MIIHVETEKITYSKCKEPDVIIGISGPYRFWLKNNANIGVNQVTQVYSISTISDKMSIACRKNNKHPADISRYKDKLKELLK